MSERVSGRVICPHCGTAIKAAATHYHLPTCATKSPEDRALYRVNRVWRRAPAARRGPEVPTHGVLTAEVTRGSPDQLLRALAGRVERGDARPWKLDGVRWGLAGERGRLWGKAWVAATAEGEAVSFRLQGSDGAAPLEAGIAAVYLGRLIELLVADRGDSVGRLLLSRA